MHRSHSSRHKPGLTRREFLKFSSAAGLFAGLPALAGSAYAQSPVETPMRVGLLLPSSTIHPLLWDNLSDGLALYFAARNMAVELLPRHISAGQRDAEKASRLLFEAGAQVIVGVLGETAIAHVAPLYAEEDVPLVVATAGENIIRDEYTHVSYSSLGYWQAAYRAGEWAAQTHGNRAAMIASLYESGYDALYAFRLGFESAGGQIIDTFITHSPANDLTPYAALKSAAEADVDVIYAAYSGSDAQDFAGAYAAIGGLPTLVTSPLMGTSSLNNVAGATSVSAWVGGYQPEFEDAYATRIGRSADAFAWLGYVTGEQALRAFVTPYTANLTQPLYRYEMGADKAVMLGTVAAPDESEVRAAVTVSSVKTGWSTPYLCA